jgi:hypothetical protein
MSVRVLVAAFLLLAGASAPAQQSSIVWSEDFERYSTSVKPDTWLDPSGLFATRVEGANVIYGAAHPSEKQRSILRRPPGDVPDPGATSTLSGRNFLAGNGFEFRGRFRRATEASLVGLTFFSRQPELDRYHQIALWRAKDDSAPTLRLYRVDGTTVTQLERSELTPEPGVWYRFTVRVDREPAGTRIRAHFWRDGEDEPHTWHLQVVDSHAAQPAGRVGLWSHAGAAHFDDLSVAAEVEDGVDRTPPAIRFSESGETIAGGSTASFNRDASVDVRAFDGSGVASLTVTIDGGPYAPLAAITSEKTHVLRARATDKAGNTAEEQIAVVVDKTRPVVGVLESGAAMPDGLIVNRGLTPSITVEDQTPTTVQVTLDEREYRAATPIDDERAHRLVVTATDAVGWTTTVTRDFVIDRTPPVIVFTEGGSVLTGSIARKQDTAIGIGATDPHGVASTTATLGGSSFQPGSVVTVEGRHPILARATDRAGNLAEAQLELILDKTPPVVTVTNAGAALVSGLLTRADVTPEITATDLTSVTVDAKLDDAPFASGNAVTAERRHTLHVTATDALGWRTTLEPIVFTIDRTPPVLTILSPANEERVATTLVDVHGNSDDAVRVVVNGVEGIVDAVAKTFRRNGVRLLEGANSIEVSGTDGAGNEGRAAARVHLDTRAPELLVLAPAPNACVAANEVVVRGTMRGATAIRVRANDGPPVNATFTGVDWTANVPLASEGPAVLQVEATDGGGHASARTLPITIDRTRPEIVFTESGSPFTASLLNRIVTPLVRATDADPNVQLSVTLDGKPFTSGAVLRGDGTHVLRASATDCAGNAETREHTFTIDTTAPRIESFDPPDGTAVGSKPSLTGRLSEPATVVEEVSSAAAIVDGVTFTFNGQWEEGRNERLFVATDPAGNVSRTPYALRVKTSAPFVEIVEEGAPIPAGALYNRSVRPVIRSNDPTALITAVLNGQPFTSGASVTADASYTLVATARDALGHTSDEVTATFTIDTTPPKITIATPIDGAALGGEQTDVRGTVDADAVSVSINGVAATLNGAAFSATVLLEPGTNLIRGLVQDRAGNSGVARVEVTRIGGPQAIVLTSPPDEMLTNRPTTVVSGQVLTRPPSGTVEVNGIEIPVTAGGTFRKVDFALQEGENDIVASVASISGERNSVSVDVQADFTPPELRVTANALALEDGARFAVSPQVGVDASDNSAQGLATELTIDGARIAGAIPTFADGGHALTAIARDGAGNETRIDRTFFVGDTGPGPGCALSAIDPQNDAAVLADIVRIVGHSGGAAGVLIDGKAAQVADGSFCGEATLKAGRNEVVIRCADASGNATNDPPVTLILWRDAEPSITITTPAAGTTVTDGRVTVTGTASGDVVSGDVNGLPFVIPRDGGASHSFSVPNVSLSAGLNTIVARAKNGAGRTAVATTRVVLLNAGPQLLITSPIDGANTGATSIDVTGTYVNVDRTTIMVGTVAATTIPLSAHSGTFRASVSLASGFANVLTAKARNHAGVETTSVVQVQQVPGAPSVTIGSPADNTYFGSSVSEVQVSGTFAGASGTQVSVNGVAASIEASAFRATVPLTSSGPNPIVARVVTPAGGDAMHAIRALRFSAPLALRESFPAADATGVGRGVAIILLFNNTLDQSTVENALRVTDGSGAAIGGSLYVDRDAISFAPNEALHPGATYTVTVAASLRDAAGGTLASPITLRFTTVGSAPATAPVVDDVETTGCLTTIVLTGRASTGGSRVRLDADGVTHTTTASDSGAFKFTFAFSGQSGFHIARVRETGPDGSLSAERALCFRLNCELPRVVGATLDRAAKKLAIEFSRPMALSTLVFGTSVAVQPSIAGAITMNGPMATIGFTEDVPPVKITLTVRKEVQDVDGASMAADYAQSFDIDPSSQERGKGYVTGAVYDATTGRPLSGAEVETAGVRGAVTNERGRYSRALDEGAYTIEASAEGFTTVWRQIVVPAGAGVAPIDIRLTRRGDAGGDTTITRRAELTLDSASLPPGVSPIVTAIGGQALAGLLPLGWSPLASTEIVLSGGESATPRPLPGAKLTFHTGDAPRTLTLVRYDPANDEWRVVVAASVVTDGKVTFDLTHTGHYALVYPDAAAHLDHPPAPQAGLALEGVTSRCPSSPGQCALVSRAFTLEPRSILPNGRAVATLVTEGATEIYPSGIAVQATIDEQLNLSDGRVLVDPPFATDLLLYRTMAGDSAVADFHLAPTPRASAVMLRDGVERIRIVEYPGRIERGALLGAEGGRVPSDAGVTIDVPSGATTEPLHARASTIAGDQLPTVAGFRVAGGFTLSLTRTTVPTREEGTVDAPPSLMIPARVTFVVPDAALVSNQVIVAEVLPQTTYGVLYRLVALADEVDRVAGGRLFATRAVDSTALPIDGVIHDGRYVVLVAEAPIAFAFGLVRAGPDGPALFDARVTANALGVTDLTPRSGLFVIPVLAKPAPPFSLTARTPATGDGANALAIAAPDAGAFVDFGTLSLLAQPPVLRSLTPDAAEIPVSATFVVRAEFDKAIDPTSIDGGIVVRNLTTETVMPGALAAAGNSVTFNAAEPLRAASLYSITVQGSIRGANGAPFTQTVTRNFRTHARPPDTTIRPERIRITLPDAQGRSVVRGEPGALPAGAQAVAVRRGRDFVVRYQATVATDGSFAFDAGDDHPADAISLDDAIDLQVIDSVSRGIIAVLALTPFVSADARAFVAPVGRDTVFISADGIRVRVPSGAFDTPTLISVVPAAKTAFGEVPRFDQELLFGTAFELQFDGRAKKRIDVDLAVPDGVAAAGRNWLLGELGQSIRGPRVMVVDLMYAAGGRFFTGIAPAGGGGGSRITSNAAITGPELRDHLMGAANSAIYCIIEIQPAGGPIGFGLLAGVQAHVDLFFDALQSLYASHVYLSEGRGRIAVPIVMGRPFQIVGVDASTGLEAFAKAYDPIAIGDPGTTVTLPTPSQDTQGPYPILGSPFRIEVLDLAIQDVAMTSVRDFAVTLGANGFVRAETTLHDEIAVAMLNVTTGRLDPSRAGGLEVEGALGDRIVLMIGERNVDPNTSFSIVFSEKLAVPEDEEERIAYLRQMFRVTLDGQPLDGQLNGQLKIRLDSQRRVRFEAPASLKRGVKYRLRISSELADMSGLRIGQTRAPDGTVSPALSDSLDLDFTIREPGGAVASFDLSEGVIRDQALHGNVLLVSAMSGGILAYDVSNPAGLTPATQPTGRHPGGATEYWALAADHHGRIYATGMTSLLGVVRSFRIEDFTTGNMDVTHRGGGTVSFVPGAALAMDIASRTIASDRPEAIPRKLQIVVQDAEPQPYDREELRIILGATVTQAIGELEELRLSVAYDPGRPYLVQRVTVENLDLDMRWSADASFGAPAIIEGIIARAEDRLRVLHNERTYGAVSLLGYGVAVIDLNAIESNDAPNKPPGYTELRELVRLTSGRMNRECGTRPPASIPDLSFTPDAAVTIARTNDLQVFALDPHRGILDLLVKPPRTREEALLPPDRVVCDERMSVTGLVFRTLQDPVPAGEPPYYDHPRLGKLRELFEARVHHPPFGRFNAAAPYVWRLEARDNHTVTPASGPGTFALGQRGSQAGESVDRHYLLVPANEYGLLVVEVGGTPPLSSAHPGAPPLNASHLVDVIWIPHGAHAVRTIPRTNLATVTDGQGHVLLVDLTRIDERWNEAGAIPADELFPTVKSILEQDVTTPDPRIVWRSEEPLASGTLAPVVDPESGYVFAGKLLDTKTNVISAIDPRLKIKADLGAAAGLSEIGGIVPLGSEPPKDVKLTGPNASLGAFEPALTGAPGTILTKRRRGGLLQPRLRFRGAAHDPAAIRGPLGVRGEDRARRVRAGARVERAWRAEGGTMPVKPSGALRANWTTRVEEAHDAVPVGVPNGSRTRWGRVRLRRASVSATPSGDAGKVPITGSEHSAGRAFRRRRGAARPSRTSRSGSHRGRGLRGPLRGRAARRQPSCRPGRG